MSGANGAKVAEWRRRTKARLVEAHGNMCIDCGYVGPAFMYDFDHRNPDEKSFGIAASGFSKSYQRQYEETLKCDLVCANCHRMRTHKQRCKDCEYCK